MVVVPDQIQEVDVW